MMTNNPRRDLNFNTTASDEFPVTIFAGGILSSVSDSTLISYFSSFGEIYNFRRMFTRDQKESGYAFFEMKTSTAEKVCSRPHLLADALVNCKVAAAEDSITEAQRDEMERKLFVSNLPPGTSDIELFTLFRPLAPLAKAYMVRQRTDGSPKNFGFVVFSTADDLAVVLANPPVLRLRGKRVAFQQAQDRQTQRAARRGKTTPSTPSTPTSVQSPSFSSSSSAKSCLLAITNKIETNTQNYRFNQPKSLELKNIQLRDRCISGPHRQLPTPSVP